MAALVRRAARQHAAQPAISCGGDTRTYADVYKRACRLANALRSHGCVPGERVGVLLPNCAEYMEVDFALALAGLVRVALNVRLAGVELAGILTAADVRALVYADDYDVTATAIADGVPGLELLLRLALRNEVAPPIGHADYETTLARASTDDPAIEPADDALYALFYTS